MLFIKAWCSPNDVSKDIKDPFVLSILETAKHVKEFKKVYEKNCCLLFVIIYRDFKFLYWIIMVVLTITFCVISCKNDYPFYFKPLIAYIFIAGFLSSSMSLQLVPRSFRCCLNCCCCCKFKIECELCKNTDKIVNSESSDDDPPVTNQNDPEHVETLDMPANNYEPFKNELFVNSIERISEISFVIKLIFVVVFLLIIIFAFISLKENIPEYSESTKLSEYSSPESDDDKKWVLSNNPVCTMKAFGFNILEQIAFTMISYYPDWNEKQYEKMRDIDKMKKILKIIGHEFDESNFEYETSGAGQMVAYRIPEKKITIFSARGTDKTKDIIADVELWAPSALISMTINFMPFVKSYSQLSCEKIDEIFTWPRHILNMYSLLPQYIDPMDKFIKRIREERPDDNFIVAGHSYGGGLAKLLAMKQNLPAISLSGPGISMTAKHLVPNSNNNNLINFVDIIPDMDVISKVDFHEGTEYELPCKAGGVACHSSDRSFCQAISMCNYSIYVSKTDYLDFCKEKDPIVIHY